MFTRALTVGTHRMVFLSLSEGRIVGADYDRRELRHDIRLRANCDMVFDVSSDGRYLATGYWDLEGVDVWDLTDSGHVCRLGPNQVSHVLFSQTGRELAVYSSKRKAVFEVGTDRAKPLKYADTLNGAAVETRTNTMWIPCARRGLLIRIAFNPLVVEHVQLPTKRVIYTIRFSPRSDGCVIVESDGRLSCYREVGQDLVWTRKFEDSFSQIAYCGNGELLAAYFPDRKRSLVLDAASGEVLTTIEVRCPAAFPFGATTAMARQGRIVDLQRGTVEEGVSKPSWWLDIGA